MDPISTEQSQQEKGEETLTLAPSFPIGRVKKIVKLDREIKKLNSEALHLISISADLFLGSLAEGARDAAISKKRRIIKLDHIRSAVRSHAPTTDFLLDCLPQPSEMVVKPASVEAAVVEKPLPAGACRIDDFLKKKAESAV